MKILIDPGHGGSDPGAVAFGTNESNINLAYALELRGILEKFEGVSIDMTRTTDAHVSLATRVTMNEKLMPDLFICIHTNAGGGTGMESFIRLNPIGKEVAIQNSLHTQVMIYNKTKDVHDRGMKKADFYVLKNSPVPAVEFELMFIDTEKDFKLLMSDDYKHGWCNELAYAIKVYYKLTAEEVPLEGDLFDFFKYIVQSLQDVINSIKLFKL